MDLQYKDKSSVLMLKLKSSKLFRVRKLRLRIRRSLVLLKCINLLISGRKLSKIKFWRGKGRKKNGNRYTAQVLEFLNLLQERIHWRQRPPMKNMKKKTNNTNNAAASTKCIRSVSREACPQSPNYRKKKTSTTLNSTAWPILAT